MTRSHRYVKFPEVWGRTLMARSATGADWRLAYFLLERAKFASEVKVSNMAAERMGISRVQKWRSLNKLEDWNLIQILPCRMGRSPIVRVRWLAGPQPSDNPNVSGMVQAGSLYL
jgi:hypothetical protein